MKPAPCSFAGTISGICALAALRSAPRCRGTRRRRSAGSPRRCSRRWPSTPSSASTCMIIRAPVMRLAGKRVARRAGLDDGVAHGTLSDGARTCGGDLGRLAGDRRAVAACRAGADSRRSCDAAVPDPLFCGRADLSEPTMRHIIAILLQNEAGALTRVAGLFSTRGYNIESLSVAPDRRSDRLAPDAGHQRLRRGHPADRQSAQQAGRRGERRGHDARASTSSASSSC